MGDQQRNFGGEGLRIASPINGVSNFRRVLLCL